MDLSTTNTTAIEDLTNLFNTYIGQTADGELASLNVEAIRADLNKIFTDKTCVEVLFTVNTDKMFFGVEVMPSVTSDDMVNILFGNEDMEVNRYSVEIDSKLFDVSLEASEITAYLLYDVSALIDGPGPVWNVRELIDKHMADEDEVIDIRNSINFSQVLILAIKDALTKVSSIRYRDIDGTLSNAFINDLDLTQDLTSGLDKIRSSAFGVGAVVKEPELVLLSWAFNVYKNSNTYTREALRTLEMSKKLTPSKLVQSEIDKCIKGLQRVNLSINLESACEVINEGNGGIFTKLKKKGLRSLEDDLYQYAVMAKNADSEEDVYYCLRQINTRLDILEEYIYDNDNISEREREKWRKVAQAYRDLREQLAKKKFSKKQYGLWYDYEKLDELDQ